MNVFVWLGAGLVVGFVTGAMVMGLFASDQIMQLEADLARLGHPRGEWS